MNRRQRPWAAPASGQNNQHIPATARTAHRRSQRKGQLGSFHQHIQMSSGKQGRRWPMVNDGYRWSPPPSTHRRRKRLVDKFMNGQGAPAAATTMLHTLRTRNGHAPQARAAPVRRPPIPMAARAPIWQAALTSGAKSGGACLVVPNNGTAANQHPAIAPTRIALTVPDWACVCHKGQRLLLELARPRLNGRRHH